MLSKQEALRKRIYEFYISNRDKGKKFTVDHFKRENIVVQTIYGIIRRADNDSGHKRIPGSGRVAKIMNKKGIERLKKMFDHKDGISTSQAGRIFGCSKAHIIKTIANKTNIVLKKKIKIPGRRKDQKEKIQKCCDRLYRLLSQKSCILNDESYFTLSHSTINGNNNFWTSDMNLQLIAYIDEHELIPYINAQHSDGQYIFWPDLASAHYANSVLDLLIKKNINFVHKTDNPPNVPEARPIEDFWEILKNLVYGNNWQAKNIAQFKSGIQYCLQKVDVELVKRLCESTRVRIGRIRSKGVIENN